MALGSRKPEQTTLVLKLAGAAAFVIVLAGVSVWVIATYLHQPDTVVITMPQATPTAALPAPGQGQVAVSPPVQLPQARGVNNQNRTITGNVVDAVTHQPVAEFNARSGYSFPQNQNQMQYFVQAPQNFTGGQFRLTGVRTNANQTTLVRIEAHGYSPMVLEAPETGPLNFALTPAKDLQGRVLSADGTPQAGVTVMVALPGLQTLISDDPRLLLARGNTHTFTGADGTYDLPPQSGQFILAAVGSVGYGQADHDALAKSTDIHLAAWGRLDGKVMFETRPASDLQLTVSSARTLGANIGPQVRQSLPVVTGVDGTFSVNKIIPGSVDVMRTVTHQSANGILYGQQESMATVNVAPGETATVTIGGTGRAVVGKLIVPPGMNVKDYMISAFATGNNTADLPAIMPDSIRQAPPGPRQVWMRTFLQTPAGQDYLKTHPDAAAGAHQSMLVMDDQNRFRIENVTPGDYQININLQTTQGGIRTSQSTAKFTMPDIPGGVSDEPLEIADIPVSAVRGTAGQQGFLAFSGGVNQTTFTGNVVDAQTHQPVSNFTARIGVAYNANGQVNYQNAPQQFTGGQYKISSNMGGRPFSWYVRIEAHGYLPELSPAMTEAGTHDFELTPAKDLVGTVFSSDGKPAAGAKLVVALPGMQTLIQIAENSPRMANLNALSEADAQGKYDLMPQSGRFVVVAYGEQGYAKVDQDALAAGSDIHLAAWGRIEGKLRFGTKPAPGEQLLVTAVNAARTRDDPMVNFQLQAMTGPDGTFSVDRVPPGPVQVARLVAQMSGQAMMSINDQPTTVAVAAGETAKVTVGGVGRPVEGKLVFPPGMSADNYFINATAVGGEMTYPPQMPDSVRSADLQAKMTWMQVFALSPAGREYVKANPEMGSQKRYAMELEPDQKFRLRNVMPGDYVMMINVQSPQGGRQGQPARVLFTMPDIPGGVSDEPLVIPDVKISVN
jgi:hypothetical protein